MASDAVFETAFVDQALLGVVAGEAPPSGARTLLVGFPGQSSCAAVR